MMTQKPAYGSRGVVVIDAHFDANQRRCAHCTSELLRSKHVLELFTCYSVLQSSKLLFTVRTILFSKLLISLISFFGFLDEARL